MKYMNKKTKCKYETYMYILINESLHPWTATYLAHFLDPALQALY